MSPKQQFIDAYRREHATTCRVLRAFPPEHSELRPHPLLRNARELAWVFVGEQGMCEVALSTGFDWSKPHAAPHAPASLAEVITMFEEGRDLLTAAVECKDDALSGVVKFPTAPRTIGEMRLAEFLWMTLSDQIHHRGQFSVYLRMAGGKVPSIYGPTADEPWT